MTIISFVVAAAENGVIGRDNTLPWHLPADLKHFKQLTLGHPILMGRNTYQSIGRPLPGRMNLVLSRNRKLKIEGCTVVANVDEALAAIGDASELMVIGGAEVYRQLLPHTDRIHLTRVHAEIEGDTVFPALEESQWRQESIETHDADERNPYPYSFIVLRRQSGKAAREPSS